MDELIKLVADKAGISPDQAKSAVAGVVDFLKAKAPGLGDQIAVVLSGGGAGDVLGTIRGKLGL